MATQIAPPQKELFWFRPVGRSILGVLAILSLGYFLGPLIGSVRRAAKTPAYLITLLLGLWMIKIFNLGTQGAVMFGVVLGFMALFTRQLVPPAIEASVEFHLQQTTSDLASFALPEADGSGNAISYFFKAKAQVVAIERAQRARVDGINTFYRDVETFKTSFPEIEFGQDTDSEETLLTIDGCELFEPRKGPTVTQRETRSGGRPFIGTKVGPLFVGGAGGSTSHSTSITTPAEDIVQSVDSGALIVTSRGISFVGSKYTRHSEFKSLIAAQGEYDRMTFADSKKTTIWGAVFPSRVDMWMVNAIIGAVDELSDRKLDTSGKASVEEIKSALKGAFDATVSMLGDFYKTANAEFEAANSQ
ncbi:MAG: hypothetical protein EBQ72_03255, partial [Actinobacteria bacterium]|nr:hypothetical protein [Actinomycetota bacterium]